MLCCWIPFVLWFFSVVVVVVTIFSWMVFCSVTIQFIAGRNLSNQCAWDLLCFSVTMEHPVSHIFFLPKWSSFRFQFVGSITIVDSGFGFWARLFLKFYNRNTVPISLLLFHCEKNKMPEDLFCWWYTMGLLTTKNISECEMVWIFQSDKWRIWTKLYFHTESTFRMGISCCSHELDANMFIVINRIDLLTFIFHVICLEPMQKYI